MRTAKLTAPARSPSLSSTLTSTRNDQTQRPACTTSDSVSTAPDVFPDSSLCCRVYERLQAAGRTRLLQDTLQQARQLDGRLRWPAKLRLRRGHGSDLDAHIEDTLAGAVSERRRLRECDD